MQTAHVVSLARTDGAGLDLKIRAEAGTDAAWEGRSLRAVQGWRAISDRWGRVLRLEQEGPLEYVPEPGPAPPSPGANANGQVLEGEIVFSG